MVTWSDENLYQCGLEWSLDQFYNQTAAKDGKHRWCKSCCREYSQVNQERANERRRERGWEWPAKRENGLRVTELKETTPCKDCGGLFPACVMDFDHIRGEKKYNVGMMVAHGHAWESILEEINKCELVCSNCHRIRSFILRS